MIASSDISGPATKRSRSIDPATERSSGYNLYYTRATADCLAGAFIPDTIYFAAQSAARLPGYFCVLRARTDRCIAWLLSAQRSQTLSITAVRVYNNTGGFLGQLAVYRRSLNRFRCRMVVKLYVSQTSGNVLVSTIPLKLVFSLLISSKLLFE